MKKESIKAIYIFDILNNLCSMYWLEYSYAKIIYGKEKNHNIMCYPFYRLSLVISDNSERSL
jgi:hypothetical protein